MSTLHPDLCPPTPPATAATGSRPGYGPHWFSMVMGTGMIAIALCSLPIDVPGLSAVATCFWALSAVLLVVVTAVAFSARRRVPGSFRAHLTDPTLGHFFGAPGIAVLSVGAATLLAGRHVLGLHLAIAVNGALWALGTLIALGTAVLVPVTAITRHQYDDASGHHPPAVGSWLLPLVGPLVSASTGALLVPHLAHTQARETLLLGSYALAGASVLTCLVTFAHLWGQLLRHGPGPAMAAPLLWIPLGFLGQSVTAFGHLADSAPAVGSTADLAPAFRAFGVVYGLPVWGCALAWLAIAVALTAHAARLGLAFSLSWWSFTFPLGTVVTASAALAHSTGLEVFTVVAVALMVALLTLWAIVAAQTFRLLVPAPRALVVRAG
ncbi:TDT family transporter [Nocardioides sp.]|uniref:TDT family transporter n=1 Tax=Nocardioides sp. TaxID=35761 RepID=UPI00263306CB|nr:TDT family transporter [Nocardioides sp.]